jgi:hypothetical protein
MKIRKLKPKDAEVASILIKNNFRKLELGRHTEEGIRIQIAGNSANNLIERSKNIHYFVMIDKAKIIGICGYDKHKIHTRFVDVNHQK